MARGRSGPIMAQRRAAFEASRNPRFRSYQAGGNTYQPNPQGRMVGLPLGGSPFGFTYGYGAAPGVGPIAGPGCPAGMRPSITLEGGMACVPAPESNPCSNPNGCIGNPGLPPRHPSWPTRLAANQPMPMRRNPWVPRWPAWGGLGWGGSPYGWPQSYGVQQSAYGYQSQTGIGPGGPIIFPGPYEDPADAATVASSYIASRGGIPVGG